MIFSETLAEQIRKDVNEYLNQLDPKLDPQMQAEPVNWMDLSCYAVEQQINVSIHEASPTSHYLMESVREMLKKKYPKLDINVITEW
jgi:hypothetical protein